GWAAKSLETVRPLGPAWRTGFREAGVGANVAVILPVGREANKALPADLLSRRVRYRLSKRRPTSMMEPSPPDEPSRPPMTTPAAPAVPRTDRAVPPWVAAWTVLGVGWAALLMVLAATVWPKRPEMGDR